MSYNLLRTCFVQGTRVTTSTARIPVAASLHTTVPAHAESARRRQARLTRQTNLEKRAKIQERAASERPHVVLGTRPGDEAKWTQSDLARVLVKPEELQPIPLSAEPSQLPGHEVLHTLESAGGSAVVLPKTFAYGITEPEKRLLFEHLPYNNAEARADLTQVKRPQLDSERVQSVMQAYLKTSTAQANMFARTVDLSNANRGGIMYENRRRIIKEFSDGKENDTGRPEVQAALLTLQIRNLWEHLTRFKRDVGNRRGLRKLVHQRAKILRYLKRVDRDRYERVLERLGLEPESVEGELVV